MATGTGLRGASIVLIGPALAGSDASEIARFDQVARIGFIGRSSIPADTTERCDISFYAAHHGERLAAWDRSEVVSVSRAVVLRSDVSSDARSRIRERWPVIDMETRACRRLFRGIVPNFAPEVIVWLLAHEPARLHLTHMDLFTTKGYPGGYATNKSKAHDESGDQWQHHAVSVRRSMSWHNPFTHFSFFVALAELANVTVSPQLRRILDSGVSAYRNTLNALYFTPDGDPQP